MQTYSHFLMTATLGRPLRRWGFAVHRPAFLIGAVLPDVPFLLLTLGYWAYYLWIDPSVSGQTALSVMEYMHSVLFYQDPIWIVGHNTLHAPLVLFAIGLSGFFLRRRRRWGNVLLWFSVGAGFHTLVDIFTHHSDGLLLFFPISWTYRFASPISYWEPGYYAGIVSSLEHVLDVGLLFYWGWSWWQGRRRPNQGQETEGSRRSVVHLDP